MFRMFTTSIGLLLRSLLLNILLPRVAGILFVRLVFGTKRTWRLLHLLARFIGVGVVAHWLFNLQFIRFGVGVGEYLLLLAVLLAAMAIKLSVTKQSITNYLHTLRMSLVREEIKTSYTSLSRIEKILTRLAGWLSLGFVVTSFVFTSNFPTYADDSFWNRNRPIINILHDGGVHLFGAQDEILARGRLGYPIHIPIYKSLIAGLQGGYNDIYVSLFQRLCLLFAIGFISIVTWDKTKNILWTVLPAGLICSLPLVFIHTVEGYHDLPVTLYAVVALRFFYSYLKTRDLSFLTWGLLVGFILSYLKIEGLIIYFPAIVLTLLGILLREGTLWDRLKAFFTNKKSLLLTGGYLLFFLIPFQIVRIIHGLWFNPSSLESGEVLDQTVHREIFKQFKPIFFQEDNYGVALIIVVFSLYMLVRFLKKRQYTAALLVVTPLVVFVLFTLVFLLTNNYQWVLNQTTVNRVYTMCFVILFAFIWVSLDEYAKS